MTSNLSHCLNRSSNLLSGIWQKSGVTAFCGLSLIFGSINMSSEWGFQVLEKDMLSFIFHSLLYSPLTTNTGVDSYELKFLYILIVLFWGGGRGWNLDHNWASASEEGLSNPPCNPA